MSVFLSPTIYISTKGHSVETIQPNLRYLELLVLVHVLQLMLLTVHPRTYSDVPTKAVHIGRPKPQPF